MKKIFYFLLAVLAVQSVQAGDKILNGGNVIVCGNNVELLDYYEARLTGKKLQFDPGLTTYKDKLNHLFERWKEVAPKRMKLYSEWLNEFESDAGIYPGIEIPEIQDTGTVAIPSGCKMIPAAFQRRDEDIFPGEKRYVINKDLWDLMDANQKAGLVLHELIYREAIKNVHETSLQTRYFNGFLSTEVTPDIEKYFATAFRMPLKWAEYGGMNIDIGEVRCSGWPGSSGCKFVYKSEYNSKKLKLKVLEILGAIKTKELSVECIGDCSLAPSAEYEYNYETKEVSLDGFTSNIKSVYVKDSLFVEDIQSDEFLSILNNHVTVPGKYRFILNVNPETSWYQVSTGVRIDHFKGYGVIDTKEVFQTLDDKLMIYSYEKKAFIKYYYDYEFQGKNMSCYLNSFPSSRNELVFNCPTMPMQISCNVSVFETNGDVSYRAITLKFADNRILVKDDKESVRIPKGQIMYYVKKRFGKIEVSQNKEESWDFIWWDENGSNCRL